MSAEDSRRIAGAGRLVLDLQAGGGRSDHLLERGDQVDQRRAHPAGHVDDLARGLVARRGQEVRAHHVRDVDEVARLQAVAEDDGSLPFRSRVVKRGMAAAYSLLGSCRGP